MNKDTRGHTTPNKDAIAYNAYLLWEKEGCPAGRDQEYWFKAESQLRSLIHKQELTPIKPSEISPMQGKSRHNSRMPERA